MMRAQLRCALVGCWFVATSLAQDATDRPNAVSTPSPERICLSEILIRTAKPDTRSHINEAKRKAEQVRNAVGLGGTFADLARAHSQGPSATQGGAIGCFSRGTLAKQFNEEVFRLKVGELSRVLETKQGFVILQVTEREPEAASKSTQQKIQNAHASGVRGTVVDSLHVPIRNAYVLAHGVGLEIHARTDIDGKYAIELPLGIYDVFISADGFSPVSRKVEVTPDSMMIFDTALGFNGLGMENTNAMR